MKLNIQKYKNILMKIYLYNEWDIGFRELEYKSRNLELYFDNIQINIQNLSFKIVKPKLSVQIHFIKKMTKKKYKQKNN